MFHLVYKRYFMYFQMFQQTELEVFRKSSKNLPSLDDSDSNIDWEETVYLNLILQQVLSCWTIRLLFTVKVIIHICCTENIKYYSTATLIFKQIIILRSTRNYTPTHTDAHSSHPEKEIELIELIICGLIKSEVIELLLILWCRWDKTWNFLTNLSYKSQENLFPKFKKDCILRLKKLWEKIRHLRQCLAEYRFTYLVHLVLQRLTILKCNID